MSSSKTQHRSSLKSPDQLKSARGTGLPQTAKKNKEVAKQESETMLVSSLDLASHEANQQRSPLARKKEVAFRQQPSEQTDRVPMNARQGQLGRTFGSLSQQSHRTADSGTTTLMDNSHQMMNTSTLL